MSPIRPAVPKALAILVLTIVVVGCSSGGVAASPDATFSAASSISAGPATAAGTTASAAPVAVGGVPDCSGGQVGRKAYKVAGKDAQLYCGPATASATASGNTVALSSGWCETTSAAR